MRADNRLPVECTHCHRYTTKLATERALM
jgi:hypothetical protein